MSTAHIVVGLGFGDEGKGSIVDFLARRHRAAGVVRFNGGPQAAHHVVDVVNGTNGRPREHTFAQFGSGTFVPGVRTHLAHGMVVNPLNLLNEAQGLTNIGVLDALQRLTIDGDCLIVTPLHVHLNRLREELRGDNRHGSCGQGVGEARSIELATLEGAQGITIRAYDLREPPIDLMRKLLAHQQEIQQEAHRLIGVFRQPTTYAISSAAMAAYESICDLGVVPALIDRYVTVGQFVRSGSDRDGILSSLLDDGDVIFEGAQGVLLDEHYGFPPHNTWTDTTPANAWRLLSRCVDTGAGVRTIGVTRCYQTRHGAGPFPTEIGEAQEQQFVPPYLRDDTNKTNQWQGPMRVGRLDCALLRYAVAIAKPDMLAVTCLDRLEWLDGETLGIGIASDYTNVEINPADPAETRAAALAEATPHLNDDFDETPTGFRFGLPAEVGVPVGILSTGPTAYDKQETGDPW